MTIEQVIGCAPFRLPAPRPLVRYEWSVVRGAIDSGATDAGRSPYDPATSAALQALFSAITAQTACMDWRQSAFGPAPAVAPFAYQCLAAWYVTLDPASQARAVADISTRGLLCAPNPPWAGCPAVQARIGQGARDLWEGAPQIGELRAGDPQCAEPRQRTSYTPMTGREMLELFRTVGGTLPADLEQAAQFGAQFVNRDFLVGIQLRRSSPGLAQQVANAPDMWTAARLAVEEMALIWAPGRGGSVLFLLDEQPDPAKFYALIQSMMPDLVGEVLPGLPQVLPWLFPTQQQLLPSLSGLISLQGLCGLGEGPSAQSPQTPPTTGVDVIDKPGGDLPKDKPPVPSLKERVVGTPRSMALWLGAAAAVLTTAFVYQLFRS